MLGAILLMLAVSAFCLTAYRGDHRGLNQEAAGEKRFEEKEADTDSPDLALQWRRKTWVDEKGVIPAGALAAALQQRQANLSFWQKASETNGAGIGSNTWQSRGPQNVGGRTRSILIHPGNTNIMWAASVGGGIWRTLDGGQNWSPANDFMASLTANCLAMNPSNSNEIYCGTGEGYFAYNNDSGFNGDALGGAGIFKTTNSTSAGATWSQLPSTASWKYVNRIAVSQNGSALIVASRDMGLQRSTNSGTTWAQTKAGNGHYVAVNPADNNKAIASVNGFEDGWVDVTITDPNSYRYVRYVSPDGGYCNVAEVEFYRNANKLSGTQFGTSPPFSPQSGFDKTFDNNVSTYFDYISANGGYAGLDFGAGNAKRITKIRFHARSDSTLGPIRMVGGKFQGSNTSSSSGYVDLFTITAQPRLGGTGESALYSTDGGATWQFSNLRVPFDIARLELAYAPSNPNIVYASSDEQWGEGFKVWRSTDGGQTYVQTSNCCNQLRSGWYTNPLWVCPTDPDFIIVGSVELFKSTNAGASFTRISSGYILTDTQPHPDQHFVVSDPNFNGTTNSRVYNSNDGGIFRTENIFTANDFFATWTSLNRTYQTTQYYGAAGHGATGLIIGGTQDNGTLRLGPSNQDAGLMFGGDGGYCAVDPVDDTYCYGEYIFLRINRSQDHGFSAAEIYSGITDVATSSANFIAPFILDPNNRDRMLAGGRSLWRSENVRLGSPPTWQAIRPPGTDLISAIAIAPSNSNVIWVAQDDGAVYKTVNGLSGSPTWTAVDNNSNPNPLPNRYATRILIDPADENKVYVAFGGFSDGNLRRTTNGGTTWTDVTGTGATGLPFAPIRGIARHPTNADWLYVGTEVGVFTSENGGSTWSAANEGPANVSVDELTFMHNSQTLLAATHGRGIWTVNAVPPPTPGQDAYVSDLNYTVVANGFGPVEKDRSNGNSGAGDGNTITLNGVPYSKGLGAHADSEIIVNLGGVYKTFVSDIGIDDEMDSQGTVGSVTFEVWLDGVKAYDSALFGGVMNTVSPTRTIALDVTGKSQMRLIVTHGPDNIDFDHADWAGARLFTASPVYVSDLNYSVVANGFGPVEKDRSNGNSGAGDGNTITLNGVPYSKGLGAHADSEIIVNLGGAYKRFVSDIGLDDEMNSQGTVGSITFEVWLDGVKAYDSALFGGIMNTITPTRTISLDVTGKSQMRLIVTHGPDNIDFDHADWAGARLVP